jgi:hypothetical protein
MKPELLKEIAAIKKQISLLEDFVMPQDVSYSNITFTDKAKTDKVNRALLDDVNLAAKRAGVSVRIGTITTGHPSMTSGKSSRHPDGIAVDVDMIDGLAVSEKIKDTVEKFNYELEKLGYKRNVERGTDKAFLTFGFKNHDNHVHISNTTDVEAEEGQKTSTTSTTSTETDTDTPRFNLEKIVQTVKDFKSGIGF